MKYHRLGGLSNECFFSQFYRLEVMVSAGLVSSEAPLLGLQITIILLCLPSFLWMYIPGVCVNISSYKGHQLDWIRA